MRGMGRMTIHFVSDDSVNYRGFQATFQKVPHYDPCQKNNPCKSGSCKFNVQNLTTICVCPPGAQGKYCDEDVKECESQPCLNGGVCKDDGPINTFECTCQFGWKGTYCESEQGSLCSPNPCKFGGRCQEENRISFSCICEEGYTGQYCETITGCKNPGIPFLANNKRFNYGTILKYSCNGDFNVKGKNNSTCLEDGTWSNEMPQCRVKGHSNELPLSAWLISMIVLGGLLAINLAIFTTWMVYQRPWSITRPTINGQFTPSMNYHQQSFSGGKSSVCSVSAPQLSATSISDIA